MKIIAFGHRRNVGKDQASSFLASHLRTTKKNINVRKLGFASKLKEVSHSLYHWAGLKDEEYYEINYKEKEIILPALGKTPREICILMGNYMREIYNDTWLDYLFKGMKADYIILKDLRFLNEAVAVKRANGLLIKLERPGIEQFDDPADANLKDFIEWDEVIFNDGSLRDLNIKIIQFARDFNL